jgi:hypothetical protein
MVKINDPRNKSGDTPRIRGAFLTLARGDKIHVQAWPKGRGKGGSPGKRYTEMKFAAQGRMAANMEGMQTLTAYEMTRDTQQVPRDFLMWCIQGRAYEIVNPDGTVWNVRADMTTNPQYVLDDITDTVGSILIRTDVGWIGLDPGNAFDVLTCENGIPAWIPYPTNDPSREVFKTTLCRTTNQATTTGLTFTASWQSAPIDENECWNAATPTRLVIPADAVNIRISTTARITNLTQNAVNTWRIMDQTGANILGLPRETTFQTNINSSPASVSMIGPWIPRPATDWVTLQLDRDVSATASFLALSTITLEATY